MKEKITEYSLPVYKSLMEKHQLFGIGEQAFYAILCLTVVLSAMISIYCIALGIIALLITKLLCKKEPLLIDFLIENINQADRYRG